MSSKLKNSRSETSCRGYLNYSFSISPNTGTMSQKVKPTNIFRLAATARLNETDMFMTCWQENEKDVSKCDLNCMLSAATQT